MRTFEQAWEATGRQYGEEELESVRLGWELREQTDPAITEGTSVLVEYLHFCGLPSYDACQGDKCSHGDKWPTVRFKTDDHEHTRELIVKALQKAFVCSFWISERREYSEPPLKSGELERSGHVKAQLRYETLILEVPMLDRHEIKRMRERMSQ